MIMPKLILEGPDGAGKTTLAEQLGGEMWHHSFYPDAKEGFWETCKSIISNVQTVDRLYYSELVYSPIHRQIQQRYGARTRMFDRLIWASGRVIVHARPGYETCHKAWASGREEMVKDVQVFQAIYEAYGQLRWNTPTVEYDWTKTSLRDLKEQLAAAADNMAVNAGPGIGHFKKGNILIVGDQANDPVIGVDLPFVHWGNSSAWLAEKLDASGISESELYWVNCKNMMGDLIMPHFVEELMPRAVVALGEDAARWCSMADVPCFTVEHPQYWKRFRNSDPYPLVNYLRSHCEEEF